MDSRGDRVSNPETELDTSSTSPCSHTPSGSSSPSRYARTCSKRVPKTDEQDVQYPPVTTRSDACDSYHT